MSYWGRRWWLAAARSRVPQVIWLILMALVWLPCSPLVLAAALMSVQSLIALLTHVIVAVARFAVLSELAMWVPLLLPLLELLSRRDAESRVVMHDKAWRTTARRILEARKR